MSDDALVFLGVAALPFLGSMFFVWLAVTQGRRNAEARARAQEGNGVAPSGVGVVILWILAVLLMLAAFAVGTCYAMLSSLSIH